MLRPLLVLGFAALVAAAHAQLYGLSSSFPSSLYTLNPMSGAATFVADVTGADGASLTGLEFLRGTLYATDVAVGNARRFGTIDPATGAFTSISDQNGFQSLGSLAADQDANLLYGFALGQVGGGDLEAISPSGAITRIGTNNESLTGLAFDNDAKVLYGVSPSGLFRISTATGAATLVGDLGVSAGLSGLAFDDASDTLYLNLGGGGPQGDSLYTVNTATGAATLVGANGPTRGSGIDGLAFQATPAPVPEPASLVALAGGFVGRGLVAVGRRRNREA